MVRTLTRGQLAPVAAPDEANRATAASQINEACRVGVIGQRGIGRGKVATFRESDVGLLMVWNWATELGWKPIYRNIFVAAINSDINQRDYLALGRTLKFEDETASALRERLLALRERACGAMDRAETGEPSWVVLKVVEPQVDSFGVSASIDFADTPNPDLGGNAGGFSAIDLRSIVRAANARLDVARRAWAIEDNLRQAKIPAGQRKETVEQARREIVEGVRKNLSSLAQIQADLETQNSK